MDYYQGVVVEYLRADRSVFVNSECFIQIMQGKQPPKGSSWYCDALAVDFGCGPTDPTTVFLCEVTYSETLQGLIERLRAWNDHWQEICGALVNDSHLPAECCAADGGVRPWLFVPEHSMELLLKKLKEIGGDQLRFQPRITTLEMVQPWNYCSWDRHGENIELKQLAQIPSQYQN